MVLWLMVLTLAAVAQTPPASAPAATPAQITELVAQLGHPRYAVRDEATARLCRADLADLPELVQRYRTESRYEQKLRLRYVCESLYYRRLMSG